MLIASALIGQAIIMATLTEGSYRDAITLLVTAVGTIEYAIGCVLLAREEDGAGGGGCVGLIVVGLGWIFLWLMLLFL